MTSSQMIPSNSISSSAHHTFSVKLTPRNYLAWKTQFNPLLNYQNLTGFVDGSTVAPSKTIKDFSTPPTEISNPEYETWYKKDQMFHSWILSSLSEEIFPYVIRLSSSYEVWQALSQAFGSVSQNRQLQLHIELQELKKNDLFISTYL
ncbi:hypothetical protein VitviT2T_023576 [Vitis vinifera]|uniref:Retrovirus-related Pol polyprotein from transposon RE1 n=1 Tax=Vitis vinifera TaxID=29760 RepID=A0ABY9DDE4_VITVI|nr:hypothetical protein VitviT2T_023576 [Vitis vinifera]